MEKTLRPNYSTGDIKASLKAALVSAIVIAVALGSIVLFSYAGWQNSFNEYENYTDFITVANEKLDADQRAEIVQVTSEVSEDDLGEDGLFIEHEKPRMFSDMVREAWVALIIIYLCTCSMATSICYAVGHNKDYYLADLPLKSVWGWYLLISNFVTWPVVFVSWLSLLRFKKTGVEKKRKRLKPLPSVKSIFDESAFVKFYYDMLPIGRRVEDAEDDMHRSESEVERYATLLKKAQGKLGEDKAKLNELRSQQEFISSSKQVKDQVVNDFAQIKEMYGVQRIYVRKECLFIRVRADYTYKNILYDLGDYEIKIEANGSFSAKMVRSNIEGGDGYSAYGTRDFCFGDKKYEICDYIGQGRLIEAIELMIECLNYINESDRYTLPTKYEAVYMPKIKKKKV
ncbi:MAG: hypothetical protein U0L97_04880 [Candidatus Saccharimonadaceae bacterium]|nr:hypothetical protein [Candidatus Saccharimonadaceae bacterium]